MAANIWSFYVVFCKLQHKYFLLEGRFKITDFEFYKQITLGVTVAFLLPVVISMAFKISKDNFCNYLALVNLIAFNFGYHVHEKAIMMVYSPLLIGCKTAEDKQRVHLLGICVFLSLCPLLPGYIEICIKNTMLLAQICWVPAWLGDEHSASIRFRLFKFMSIAIVAGCGLV